MSLSKQVKIILIETTNSGNIGSALRAMKTMNFSRLCLVRPKDFPSDEVETMATNAKDLIKQIEVVDNLDEALEGMNFIVGTSSRMRKVPWPNETLENASPRIISEVENKTNVAILFGREDRGLTNDELQRCNLHLYIPANKDYPVLNLSMAVQVVCYQLYIDGLLHQDYVQSEYWDVPSAEANHVNLSLIHISEPTRQP